VDSTGNAYVTGSTTSVDFPTVNALFPTLNGTSNAFVTKVALGGTALVYSTYLGGSGQDVGGGIAVDAIGNAYVTGKTNSPDFPTVDALQPSEKGVYNAFVAELNVLGDTLNYSSYMGGSGYDEGYGIAAPNDSDNVYLAGSTTSADFPLFNPIQPFLRGLRNAFIALLRFLHTRIVDVIPVGQSGETNQDSEPSIAVAPTADPATRRVAITTFSRTDGRTLAPNHSAWGDDRNSPVFVSSTGGRLWTSRSMNPEPTTYNGDTVKRVTGPWDQTVAFNSNGSTLYGGFLSTITKTDDTTLDRIYLRSAANPTTDNFTDVTTLPGKKGDPDQPWLVQVARVGSQDRVYVGYNDLDNTPRSASVSVVAIDTATRVQDPIRIDGGNPTGQDSPAVRLALNGNRVYAAYMRYTGAGGATTIPGDIVVARDDDGGLISIGNPNPFRVIGGAAGVTVNSGALPRPNGFFLGQQRIGGDLAIAVDPNNSMTVYLAYVFVTDGQPVLHVRKSTEGGAAGSWGTADILTINNAALPALAVAANGTWGLLYTRLTGTGAGQMMSTEFYQKQGAGAGRTTVLTAWPKNNPTKSGALYIGDYQQTLALGNTFYGTFSASNEVVLNHFPNGVYYQRYFKIGGTVRSGYLQANGKLDDGSGPPPAAGTEVSPSIDPFFFTLPAF
jgi:hypothetical protein